MRNSTLPSLSAAALGLLLVAIPSGAQTTSPWRYDLHAGDHLTYRTTYQRQSKDKEDQFLVESRFRSHALVTAVLGDNLVLGFQRNREAAELKEYLSKGKDRLSRELPNFQDRLKKRPSRFSEAMIISPAGEARYPWEIARESPIRLLDAFHEVMTLPVAPLKKGESLRQSPILGLDLRWVDDETIHGKLCHHLEAASPDQAFKISYWWSPDSGLLEQLLLDETYIDFDTQLHETARMELESRVRGESLDGWLSSADARLGALQAILLSKAPLASEQLAPVFTADDPAAHALALAVATSQKIQIASGPLSQMQHSSSEQVRKLAEQFTTPKQQPLVDECQRPLPPKIAPEKFGTIVQSVAATSDHPEIAYLLRIPLAYGNASRPLPLLVYLSGGAGNAIDAVNTAEGSVAGSDYLVLYPQAGDLWWKPEAAHSFDIVLNDVLQRYNVDRDRVYITGFSNGGTGALYYATLWPQRFAAVVSLMGAGQCNAQIKAALTNLKNLPILFAHGENDVVITPDCSKATHSALLDLNPAFKPELKILPKHGHDLTLESDGGLTLAFLEGKVRDPYPHNVDLTLSDFPAPRAYWLEIVDGKAGKSDIDARVKADNTIDIHSHEVKKIRLHLRRELFSGNSYIHVVWNGKKIFNGPLRDVCSLPLQSLSPDPQLDFSDTRELVLP